MLEILNDPTRSVINWLSADESNNWLVEAELVWKASAAGVPSTRMARATSALAQWLESHVVDSAPEYAGDVYGHLLADAIGCVDWNTAAGWLLGRVGARAAA